MGGEYAAKETLGNFRHAHAEKINAERGCVFVTWLLNPRSPDYGTDIFPGKVVHLGKDVMGWGNGS